MPLAKSSKDFSGVEAVFKPQVIIPTLNEGVTLPLILKELKRYADDVIVVDGGSEDETVGVARRYGARVILQVGQGKGTALCQAFQEVNGGPVITLDADGSMKPSEIPFFLEEIEAGADLVKGSRFLKGGYSEDMSLLRYLGNRFFVKLINLFFSEQYSDLCYGYIALSNKAIRRLTPMLKSRYFEIETEVVIKAKKLGLKIVEVPSVELKRFHGQSRLRTLRDGFSILKLILNELSSE